MKDLKPVIPTKENILSWIKTICDMGYRRPGSEADHKVENFLVQLLREFGVSDIKKDEFDIPLWEPENWKFTVELDQKKEEIPSFFLVYTDFTDLEGVSGQLVNVQTGRDIDFQKNDINGKIAIIDFRNPPLIITPFLKGLPI